MTPEAARKTWCPHAVPFTATVMVNRDRNGGPAAGTMCLADQCSQWRWLVGPRRIEDAKALLDRAGDNGVGTTGVENAKMLARCVPTGYCGKAGSHGVE